MKRGYSQATTSSVPLFPRSVRALGNANAASHA
jgi:hypothetical protein